MLWSEKVIYNKIIKEIKRIGEIFIFYKWKLLLSGLGEINLVV